MTYHIILYHIISYHIMIYHITPYYVISYHIILYHIILPSFYSVFLKLHLLPRDRHHPQDLRQSPPITHTHTHTCVSKGIEVNNNLHHQFYSTSHLLSFALLSSILPLIMISFIIFFSVLPNAPLFSFTLLNFLPLKSHLISHDSN